MTDETKRMLLEETIVDGIKYSPEIEPPLGFSKRVMEGLEPYKPSLMERVRIWFMRPRTLTVRPMQAIPAVVCAIALFALAIIKVDTPADEAAIRLSTVRFVMHDADRMARKVAVIGSFNNWRAERSLMWYSEKAGAWVLEAQLPPGDHEYMFLVNGKDFVPDPLAEMVRDDGFGNKNSIVFVSGDNEQAL